MIIIIFCHPPQFTITLLKMKNSSTVVRKDLRGWKIVPDFLSVIPMSHLGYSDYGPDEAFEEDTEMLRRG